MTARIGVVTFPGSLLWPYLYLYPPRPDGLIEAGFAELPSRWRPILDAFDEAGVDLCFEIHPGEVCRSLGGEPLAETMSLGVRSWGNHLDGDTVMWRVFIITAGGTVIWATVVLLLIL